MIKKLLLILLFPVLSYAYMGDLHSKLMSSVPDYLSTAGYQDEADTLLRYMHWIKEGVKSPDNDYPELKIPGDMIPDWLKPIANTSVGKWEHTLPNDVPKEVDKLLRDVAAKFDYKFRYADEAIGDWMTIAQQKWADGQIDSSMWYLSRTCHLIQDITVPMHCRVTGNLKDVWEVLNHQQSNHNEFEKYCGNCYVAGGRDLHLNDNFPLPKSIQDLAKLSRKELKWCDGIGPGGFFNLPVINSMFPCLCEDYDKAANDCLYRAEKYTTQLVHYFFMSVK